MVATLRTAIIALCIGAVLGLATGWTIRGDHLAAQQLNSVQQGVKQTAKLQTTVDALELQQTTQNTEQSARDTIITKEVIRYVATAPATSRCTLPGNWRLLHDAAATGTPAEPPSLAADQAEPVTDAAALAIVADNYTACRAYIQQVEGWQDFWAIARSACQGAGQ